MCNIMNKSNVWTAETVAEYLKNYPLLDDFISGKLERFSITVDCGPVLLFREDVGCGYYFAFPMFQTEAFYHNAKQFMTYCIPILSKKIEKYREAELCYNPHKTKTL